MTHHAPRGCPLLIALGAPRSPGFDPGVPVLAGTAVERLFGATRSMAGRGPFALHRSADWLLGAATVTVAPGGLAEATQALYADALAASRGWHLARLWNYVPAINDAGPSGQEGYRDFCRGRSLAFEQYHGNGFEKRLPAASAVGGRAGALSVVLAASLREPRHVENPRQLPAYEYPDDYGPRAPSFARATVVPGPAGAAVFISGTAAILGHATVAADRMSEQLACTLENLGEIAAACGLGRELDRAGGATRHFKVYLRHAADYAEVARRLEERLLTDRDRVTYLRADLCRAALRVEIEASLFGVKLAPG